MENIRIQVGWYKVKIKSEWHDAFYDGLAFCLVGIGYIDKKEVMEVRKTTIGDKINQ